MNEWIVRNKGDICAGLAAVSVLLGMASLTGWFENSGARSVLIVFCLILLCAVIMFLTRRKNIVINGSRFLSDETADTMMAIAMKPQVRYPICIHLAGTHAAGSCVAGLVARTMETNINFLQDQVVTCWGEILVEGDFRVRKLEEHMDILLGLNSLLFCMTAERVSYPEEKQNIVSRTLDKLPHHSLRSYHQGIIKAKHILEEKVLCDMAILVEKIRESAGEKWEEEIKTLLHDKVAPQLSEIWKELEKIKSCLGKVIAKLKADWERDVNQIWDNKTCRPVSEKKCP